MEIRHLNGRVLVLREDEEQKSARGGHDPRHGKNKSKHAAIPEMDEDID
jgi:co-chaperonin GroES (HSP10)